MTDVEAAKLVRVSRRMRWLCLAMLPLIAGVGAWAVHGFATNPAGVAALVFPEADVTSMFVAPWQRATLAIVAIVHLLFFAAAFLALAEMFGRFARHDYLSAHTALHLRKAGVWFVASAAFGVFSRTASVLLLTIGNPAGARQVTIGLTSDQLFPLVLAGVLFAVGHILSAAAQIQEENRGFV